MGEALPGKKLWKWDCSWRCGPIKSHNPLAAVVQGRALSVMAVGWNPAAPVQDALAQFREVFGSWKAGPVPAAPQEWVGTPEVWLFQPLKTNISSSPERPD